MQNQISNNWQKVKLGEVVDITSSKRIFAKEYQDKGIPFYRGKEIIEKYNGNKVSTDLFISPQKFDEIERRFGVPLEDDMLLTSVGTLGIPYLVKENEKFYFKDGNLTWFRKHNGIDSKFLYYWISSSLGKDQLIKHTIGSSQQALTIDGLKKVEIELPLLGSQKQIAFILSAFDDKIEVNNKIAKTLEEMAQAIFKEWFVHFRFLGHEKLEFVDSELGKIPKAWKVKLVEELVKRVAIGKRFDTNTVKKKGAVPVLDQGKSGIIGYHDRNPDVKASENNPVIVFANHTCYQNLIMFSFSAIQNVIPFYSSEIYYRNIYWLYLTTFGLVRFNDYKGHWPEFASKRVLLPPEDLCEKFGKVVEPMFISKYKLEMENQKLSALRDLLLPKLMRGEIKV